VSALGELQTEVSGEIALIDEKRKVEITGGTFMLCVWLFAMLWPLWEIADQLERIADKLK